MRASRRAGLLPDHLPRERVVHPSPCLCGRCGGSHLRKLGEIVTETLERALRAVALGRANCTFAGSDRGAERAAAIYTLIATCKLNSVDPQAYLADVLARLPDYPARRIDDLMPWHWQPHIVAKAA